MDAVLLPDIALQAQEWKIQLREAWEICQETGGPMPYLPMIEEDLRHAEAVCGAAGSFGNDLGGIGTIYVFASGGDPRQKRGRSIPEKKALVSDCRSRVKKAVEKLKESTCLPPGADAYGYGSWKRADFGTFGAGRNLDGGLGRRRKRKCGGFS